MNKPTKNIWKLFLGTALLVSLVQAGQALGGEAAKGEVKLDSSEMAVRKASADASSRKLSMKMDSSEAKTKAVSKDSEKIRKSDDDRAKSRVKKLKQEVKDAAKARKAKNGYMTSESANGSKESSPSVKK